MPSESETIVITPTRNERENIALHVRDVFRWAPGVTMLVVDDKSRDGTQEHIEELRSAHYPRLNLLARKGPPSFAGSYRDGFQWALRKGFRFLISMDADRSHPATTIPSLLRVAEGSDLVVASRYVRGVSVRNWPLRRVLLSAMANRYARLVTTVPCSDLTSGFCLYRAAIAREIASGSIFTSGYAFLIETKHRAWRAGARLAEVPYTFTERREGASKMNARRLLEGIAAPVMCRTVVGRPAADIRGRPTVIDETDPKDAAPDGLDAVSRASTEGPPTRNPRRAAETPDARAESRARDPDGPAIRERPPASPPRRDARPAETRRR